MNTNDFIGYALAVLVGISLGLIGSGGSILSVPILVYIMKVEPVLATAYSLFTVGITALVGGLQKAKQQAVDFKKVLFFGMPTVVSVFITRKFIVPNIPEKITVLENYSIQKSVLIMIVFAIVMLFASIKMIQPISVVTPAEKQKKPQNFKIVILALFIGLVAGFVGAGGGFLIIPVLVFYTDVSMKKAIGTSLFIIAMQSLLGFTGDLQSHLQIHWNVLLTFTTSSVIGIFVGNYLSKNTSGEKLKTSFGWFVLSMGIYIFVKEIFLK